MQKLNQLEAINRPHYSRFAPQGIRRLLIKVYEVTEAKNEVGLIIPVDAQDVATTGCIVATSADFGDPAEIKIFSGPVVQLPARAALKLLRFWNRLRNPGLVIGANVVLPRNSWTRVKSCGELLAWCAAESVIASYGWEGEDTMEKESTQTRDSIDKFHKERQQGLWAVAEKTKGMPSLPNRIVMK